MHRAGRALRAVSQSPGAALRVLVQSPGVVLLLLRVAIQALPRRVPDLARMIRSSYVGERQRTAAGWIDRNFDLIQRGAPWLDPVGRWVCDRCTTSWASRGLFGSIPRDPPRITCSRAVTVVYGCDGSLPDRLGDLSAVLGTAGFGEIRAGAWVRCAAWAAVRVTGTGPSLPSGLLTGPSRRDWLCPRC
jgi:hypothetical protein